MIFSTEVELLRKTKPLCFSSKGGSGLKTLWNKFKSKFINKNIPVDNISYNPTDDVFKGDLIQKVYHIKEHIMECMESLIVHKNR